MRNFHIKSILLGIGIGIVLTSIISMIFLAGRSPESIKDADTNAEKIQESSGLLK